jgi:hypothetical protein
MQNKDFESEHFETSLDYKSYMVLLFLLVLYTFIAVNICRFESSKKDQVPTMVIPNIQN